MKKILVLIASLAMLLGAASSANASAASPTQGRPAVQDSAKADVLAQLQASPKQSAASLRAMGLRPLAGQDLSRAKKMTRKARTLKARTSTVGDYLYGTYQYYGYAWYDLRYSYYSINSSYFYLYYFQNWKICTTSGTGCVAANAYHYGYYIYYYGTWYGFYGYYGPYSG